MHEKKHNVPTAVDGGSLHMPSNFDDADCAAAGMLHQTMAAKINETDRIRMARRITRKHSGIIARLFQPRRMMALIAGTQVGPYQILSLAGTGGMGEVYRARDPKLGRDVALKVLPDSLANDQERTARFEREARTLAALNHPNIASIYGFEAGALVMELVEGATPKGPMPFDEAWHIASQIIAALEYAHASGIIHRDLKPANIKVTADGVVKLLDFGLAKVFTEPGVEKSADLSNSPTLTMATEVGVILGTAAYMAPEQAKGRNVDKRADIWAFGVVLYELLTGHQLFQAEDVSETLAQVLTKQPDWNKVPPKARALLQACLEKDPKRRFAAPVAKRDSAVSGGQPANDLEEVRVGNVRCFVSGRDSSGGRNRNRGLEFAANTFDGDHAIFICDSGSVSPSELGDADHRNVTGRFEHRVHRESTVVSAFDVGSGGPSGPGNSQGTIHSVLFSGR
jgi:serine/threonine protein kinase